MPTISNREYGYFKRTIKKLKRIKSEAVLLANNVLKFSHGDDLVDLHDTAYYFLKRNDL